MTLEFGSRLARLRKERGYSQEELAEKLGVSRQAVSKWERGEASPDTDNLIALAALYEITLDALIQGDSQTKETRKECVHIGFDGIHVENEKESVHVSLSKGVHVEADGNQVHVDRNGVYVKDAGGRPFYSGKGSRWKQAVNTAFPILVVAVYILIGAVWNLWHPGWILFLMIPVVCSLADAVDCRDARRFAWPVLVTAVYLWFGVTAGLWHPLWVLYLTVPVYYMLAQALRRQ